MKHVRKTFVAFCAIVALSAAVTACEVPDEKGTAADRTDTKNAAKDKVKAKDGGSTKTKSGKPEVKETTSQANAREAAANYLDLTGFSHDGLVQQLVVGDGYSKADAIYGAEAQHADWNAQAALSAKNYLDMTSFSHDGLVQQLVTGDHYTKAQAEYGVKKVGL